MKYGVICYAVHNKNISSYDWFDDIDDAVMFLHDDAENTYQEEIANGEKCGSNYSNTTADIIGHYARVSSCNGEYEWTWHIIDDSEH